MSFQFVVPTPPNVSATLDAVKKRVEFNNGMLSGDATKGAISCDGVEGSYEVKQDGIHLTIFKKPAALIPDKFVQMAIESIFKEEAK